MTAADDLQAIRDAGYTRFADQLDCAYCHLTGWAETVDGDGYAWVTRCPQGCPVPEADALIPHHREVT